MEIIVANSIAAFGAEEWNRLFPDELEDWSYYLAVERSGLPGFVWVYFAVRENGQLLAAVPAFITDYRVDTTLTGSLRRVTDALASVFPRLLRQRMLSLGSPVAEMCHLGFAPGLDAARQRDLLEALLAKAEEHAAAHRAGMIAAKDTAQSQDAIWVQAARARHLRRQPGLPGASLDVRYATFDEYLGSLSRSTRRDLRRKLKKTAELRVEWRSDIDDVRDDVMRLYRATRANAELDFEELTPDYFSCVLREMGTRAKCALYWLGERLVAFNIVLADGKRLLDKFLGMDYAVAREYNLYFYTWMENVRYCIEQRLPVYQSGQGLHREKLRLGSRLSMNWLWYRHRNRILDALFVLTEKLARLDRHDAELAKLVREPRA
jgi:predicted N-acyltransferase